MVDVVDMNILISGGSSTVLLDQPCKHNQLTDFYDTGMNTMLLDATCCVTL
jgi:hypothetical protein